MRDAQYRRVVPPRKSPGKANLFRARNLIDINHKKSSVCFVVQSGLPVMQDDWAGSIATGMSNAIDSDRMGFGARFALLGSLPRIFDWPTGSSAQVSMNVVTGMWRMVCRVGSWMIRGGQSG